MAEAPEALLVEASRGAGERLYLYHRPAAAAARSAVLFVHAFAEEMNKSRRMAAQTARALATAGHAVLQVDLAGCGDSSGDFRDASWDAWLDDARQALAWLSARHPGAAPVLWGHRAGCLIASALAQERAADLLLWQPPATGKTLLQQFMRLKLAAGLGVDAESGEPAGGAELMRAMRATWQRGGVVNIAGYDVPAALASGFEAAALRPPPEPRRVAWLEVSPRDSAELLPGSAVTVERWRSAGHDVQARAVGGPSFWQTVEIEDAPALVAATVEALEVMAPGATPGGRTPSPATGARSVPADARFTEQPLWFGCGDDRLPAIVSRPAAPRGAAVLIVVGGPQYRAGSHRQFVQLARALAAAGHPAMRFDVRGMGDATGGLHTFEQIDADIEAALAAFARVLPADTPIVLWGLCDGASAALMAAPRLADRAAGLALANPWVRSATTLARTHVKHYYRQRLLERDFWLKLVRGGVGAAAVRGLLKNVRLSRRTTVDSADFRARMAAAAAAFGGPTLLLMSEHDLTAREFDEFTARDATWLAAWQRHPPQRADLADADHTFSGAEAQHAAERATLEWLTRFEAPPR